MQNKDMIWKIRKYFEGKGHEIIDQNYSTKYFEINLIIKKDSILNIC